MSEPEKPNTIVRVLPPNTTVECANPECKNQSFILVRSISITLHRDKPEDIGMACAACGFQLRIVS